MRAALEWARAYADAPPVPAGTPWREASYCVLDLETTGLDLRRDQIVSYAAVPVDGGRIQAAGIREGLVKPSREVSASSVCIHGIRPQDLAAAPALEDVLDDLVAALTGRVLVVHVDRVERAFLGRALRSQGLRLREPVLDTARLARSWLPDAPEQVALGALARRLGLPVYTEHEAVGDALTTAQVFVAVATLRDPGRTRTLGDLCAVGSAPARRAVGRWRS